MTSRRRTPLSYLVHDTLYELDSAYLSGAKAFREGKYQFNPHRYGSYRHSQWDDGYQNESEQDTALPKNLLF